MTIRVELPDGIRCAIALSYDLEMCAGYSPVLVNHGRIMPPLRDYTLDLCATAEEFGVQLQFFYVGNGLEDADIEYLHDIVRRGHAIDNHTYNHVLLTMADTDLVRRAVGYDEAVELGLARPSPVLLEHLVGLPGFEIRTVTDDDGTSVQPVTPTRFRQLDVVDQFFHTVASPAVAYLLLLVGMGLLVFELYTAGVGIAGMIGAGSFLLATYGLGVLPARAWAVGVLVFAFVGFAIDVQAGVPRLWSVIGSIALVVGSVYLFEGNSFSWITLLVGVVGTIAGVVGGMPAMVRTRFSTPTIGREWMVGEVGTVEERLGPNGTVRVRDAVWRATTNRATPVELGGDIRVVAVDGLWLEVEPTEGAARDYRR